MDNIAKLAALLPEDIDGALIDSPVNRRYCTGFASSAGTLLVTREKSWLIIDSRYFEAARANAKGCQVVLQDRLYRQLDELMKQSGTHSLALESSTTTLRELSRLREHLPNARLITDNRLSDAIKRMRCIKSPEEIAGIQAAQRIADDTFAYILNFIAPGKTEREIALEMEFYSRKKGSEGAAFSFIVVSGKNSSMPHGVPTDKQVEAGDLITMDFGCIVGGYRSDMTRTIAVGHVGDKQHMVYHKVLEAQLSALDVIQPGKACKDVDKTARDIIAAAGFGDCFGHGLGHSLGLEVHEDPRFGPSDETVLEAGMVMSVEPGIYIAGEFGVRIEDIIHVTPGGYDNLVTSPKELVVL